MKVLYRNNISVLTVESLVFKSKISRAQITLKSMSLTIYSIYMIEDVVTVRAHIRNPAMFQVLFQVLSMN